MAHCLQELCVRGALLGRQAHAPTDKRHWQTQPKRIVGKRHPEARHLPLTKNSILRGLLEKTKFSTRRAILPACMRPARWLPAGCALFWMSFGWVLGRFWGGLGVVVGRLDGDRRGNGGSRLALPLMSFEAPLADKHLVAEGCAKCNIQEGPGQFYAPTSPILGTTAWMYRGRGRGRGKPIPNWRKDAWKIAALKTTCHPKGWWDTLLNPMLLTRSIGHAQIWAVAMKFCGSPASTPWPQDVNRHCSKNTCLSSCLRFGERLPRMCLCGICLSWAVGFRMPCSGRDCNASFATLGVVRLSYIQYTHGCMGSAAARVQDIGMIHCRVFI